MHEQPQEYIFLKMNIRANLDIHLATDWTNTDRHVPRRRHVLSEDGQDRINLIA